MSQNTSCKRPNVIFVLTDDQGYGDLGCTGNPWINTPNIDSFHDQSVRFTDFHVAPLCAPTRGALMTGHNPLRNGVWATAWGRSLLRKTETTLPRVMADSGYVTGMFGKWHLGDNYPYRPHDRGFQHVVAHKGGGVGQTPDFWGNNYFDDTYFHNGEPVAHEGYCTDVWFEEALKFIKANRETPFFCYIATNAPHAPYLVAEKYKKQYTDNNEIPEAAFYGMISNIDENFGRLMSELKAMNIEDDTILMFMTDNGSSAGWDDQTQVGYNAGMRGRKGSYYDGGHRVPFLVRWPGGGIQGGKDVDEMVMHVDFFPTILDLCGIEHPGNVKFDGFSVAPMLRGEDQPMPDRVQFVQFRQHTTPPEKWMNAVITRQWRLVFGKELYDIKADPGQKDNLAEKHPDVVERLRKAHENWWGEVSPVIGELSPISLGNKKENPTRLDAMDVMGDIAWSQSQIVNALKASGRWTVDVEQSGRYRFTMRRWPRELELPIDAPLPQDQADAIAPYYPIEKCGCFDAKRARLSISGQEIEAAIPEDAIEVTIELDLDKTGVTELTASFSNDSAEDFGAYYVYVERMID